MAHFHDLTPYQYGRTDPEPNVLNIGWLDIAMPYVKGETSPEFHDALAALCAKPMRLFRGWHSCQFCAGAGRDGNGEIRVRAADGTWYVAPKLIHHYVTAHNYSPPAEFVAIVLAPAEVGRDD